MLVLLVIPVLFFIIPVIVKKGTRGEYKAHYLGLGWFLFLSAVMIVLEYKWLAEGVPLSSFFPRYPVISLLVLIGLWLLSAFTFTTKTDVKICNEIDDLYEQAFFQNDDDALWKLVCRYKEGKENAFFKNHKNQAYEVFKGHQRWLQLAELEGKDSEYGPVLEDYYWLGRMYEEGFVGDPDFAQAKSYYEKALDTTTCNCGRRRHYWALCQEIKRRLDYLEKLS